MQDNSSTRMERLRADLIRRARLERHADVEQAIPQPAPPSSRAEMGEQSQQPPARFAFARPALPRLFGRRQDRQDDHVPEIASPKSPDMPTARLNLPPLAQTWTHPTNAAAPHMPVPPAPVAMPPSRPAPAEAPPYSGPDPAEAQLAQLADDGRQRTHRKKARRAARAGRERARRGPPRRFLFCFPWVKSQRMRSRILRCFVSGMFLFSLLAVYLGLSLTKKVKKGELTIMLILVILMATVFFCYSLLQLVVLVVRGDRAARANYTAQHVGPGGYVIPTEPIRVVLARDEEAAGVEAPAGKMTPPAYGLWRESVRVDPDRLFWQRNDAAAAAEEAPRRHETSAGPRPPSYASDDGVSYVVEAAPRSTAPRGSVAVPLPVHPSEVGRMGQTRAAW